MPPPPEINNDYYHELGQRWYCAQDDPIALLRAESKIKNRWVEANLRERIGDRAKLLDIGCGAGFLTNALARAGFDCVGLDASLPSLEVAARFDEGGRVEYRQGDALHLPFADDAFDAVCAMDFLEHVEDPARVVREAARVLKPGGVFFFHTFNRNFFSWLVVIKGMEWFVKNTPAHLHLWRLFIKPKELDSFCRASGLEKIEMAGLEPVLFRRNTWRLIASGRVPEDFEFRITPRLWAGYIGTARKPK